MTAALPWTFRQIGGQEKQLALTGYSAPFGRPRRSPVVSDGYGLRMTETYYPGFGAPARHIFGDIHDHWELKGRWMDSVLGPRGARDQVLFVKQMIADALPVRIAWGSLIAFTGWLVHIKPDRESDAQIAWTLTIAIDSDDLIAPGVAPSILAVTNAPSDQVAAFVVAQQKFQSPSLTAPTEIVFPLGLLDSIDSLVTTIATFTGSLVAIADAISNFATATTAELNRLRGVIGQIDTAYQTLASTLDDARCDFAVGDASCNAQSAWATLRETDQEAITEMRALLATLDLVIEIALRSEVEETATAQDGDTWESLSVRHYGSLSRADQLRQANRARYGEKPAPGRPLSIPRA